MKVSELAKALNTTVDTVRFYTREGCLSPLKSSNGYKSYSPRDEARLRFILCARRLGFSVSDIQEILKESDAGHSACPKVRELIRQRMAETEAEFQAVLRLRRTMGEAITQWAKQDDMAPTSDMICHLIENFNFSETAVGGQDGDN